MTGRDCDVNLRVTEHPEFDAWRWHDYWVPLDVVIEFKRDVYQRAMQELSRFLTRPNPGTGHNRASQGPRYLRQGSGAGRTIIIEEPDTTGTGTE